MHAKLQLFVMMAIMPFILLSGCKHIQSQDLIPIIPEHNSRLMVNFNPLSEKFSDTTYVYKFPNKAQKMHNKFGAIKIEELIIDDDDYLTIYNCAREIILTHKQILQIEDKERKRAWFKITYIERNISINFTTIINLPLEQNPDLIVKLIQNCRELEKK